MINRVSLRVASARGVAERWRSSYQGERQQWTRTVSGDSEKVYNNLCDLGQNPNINDVAKIIGNKSWCYLACSGCNESVERAVSFGSEWGEREILLCEECVADANKVLKKSAR